MRVFIAVLVLIFNLQFIAKADDIRDFQIEGMSIGDSLLNHFSKNEIESSTKTTYSNKKFHDIHIKVDSDNYDQLSYTVKTNDNNYKIEQISGDKYYYRSVDDNIDKKHLECLKQKDLITQQFEEILSDTKRFDYKHIYKTIDDGNSFSVITDFNFKDSSAIRIYCNKFTKETVNERNFFNGLSVSVSPIKILNWLNNEAYK